MKRFAFFVAPMITVLTAVSSHAVDAPARVKLCQALTSMRGGEPEEIEVSGVYVVGMESQTLYDPAETPCAMSVQSDTWMEIAPDAPTVPELGRLLTKSHRAFVTVRGELYGPGPVPDDDPRLSASVSLVSRLSARRRYGHLGGWRTKLVVHEISDVRAVPESTPWPSPGVDPDVAASAVLQSADLPRYPESARRLGIRGDVELEVSVAGGMATANVLSGDRALSGEAVNNVHTWRFPPSFARSFVTRFVYRLEQRPMGADASPRIVIELPRQVIITAVEHGW